MTDTIFRKKFEVYLSFSLGHVLPNITEGKEFMMENVAHRQGVIKMFWLTFFKLLIFFPHL